MGVQGWNIPGKPLNECALRPGRLMCYHLSAPCPDCEPNVAVVMAAYERWMHHIQGEFEQKSEEFKRELKTHKQSTQGDSI